MRKLTLLLTLAGTLLTSVCLHAQDFSNKGRDFWVGYGYHQTMGTDNSQDMILYFATDAVTTVTVSIPSLGWSETYPNIPANTVFASNPMPKNFPDARLTAEGQYASGIHITATKPVVAYAHVYNQSVSGATILYPTNTLGKEYYSVNFTNNSNTTNANCWFYVVATDTGTTTVEITPSAATLMHSGGIPFTVTLQQGEIYNVMGLTSGNNGVDLTGSTIKSISVGTGGCKRIAVFSGSGRIAISCNGSTPSSDNYMVQALPKTAWGRSYLTVPSAYYNSTFVGGLPLTNNFYRVCIQTPGTNVLVNGAPISFPLINNFYYEIPAASTPLKIEADQPIMVAQYFPSQTACGAPAGDGDPEVIYLSPVEQSINKVQWNACRPRAIDQFKHWINVVIPNKGVPYFKLDGNLVPPGTFTIHPGDPNYSYAVLNVVGLNEFDPGAGVQHTVSCDSASFNAIAYGYGNAESYGYNAGTNVKDLYQFVQLANPFATVNFPAACQGTPFNLSIVFPYQPTQITWELTGIGYPNVTVNPLPILNPVTGYDSTWVVNGKTLYRYKLPTPYTIVGVGTFPIRVVALNPLGDGCTDEQEIIYDLEVFPPPAPDFTHTGNCLTDSVRFFGTSTNTGNRPIIKHTWDFSDPPGASIQNPAHLFSAPGTYLVSYSVITDVGCVSNATTQFVQVNAPPVANFAVSSPTSSGCVGQAVSFVDQSTPPTGTNIIKWTWNFGDSPTDFVSNVAGPITHTYAAPGTYTVTLVVEIAGGCKSVIVSKPVTIGAKPTPNFTFGGACLPSGSTQFTDASSVAAPSTIQSYAWNFGDAGPGVQSTATNPNHPYATAGPFEVTLTVTTNMGCVDSIKKQMNQVYAQPHADFNINSASGCLGASFTFSDASTAPPNIAIQTQYWDFGDATGVQTGPNPSHTYALAGTYNVRHWIVSATSCMSDTMTKQIVVHPLPTASYTYSTLTCQGSAITFTSTSAANAGTITNYNWTVNAVPTGGNNASITYTPTAAGNITVVLSITTSNGCTSSITQTINVNPKPVADFTFGGACLPSGLTQFTSTSTISDNSPMTYEWNFGDGPGVQSTLAAPTHVYATSGPFTVTLNVLSNNGCTATVTKLMDRVFPQPHADFNISNPTACLGTATTFTDNSNTNATGVTIGNHYWDFGDATSILTGTGTVTHTYAAPGTYTVKHWITSSTPCMSDTMEKQITVLALPTASFTYSTLLCKDTAITFTSTSNPINGVISGYNWTVNGNPVTGGATMTYTPTASGPMTVALSVTTSNGCIGTVTQTVNVNPKPVADFTFGGACLPSGITQFNSTSTISDASPLNYAWNFGDGPGIQSTIANPTHPYATSGPFTVTLTVTSNNNCQAVTTKLMDRVFPQPHADFNIGNPTACLGTATTFTDNSNTNATGVGVGTQYWDFGDGTGVQTGANLPHTYATAGTYTVRHWITSTTPCMSDTMQKQVTVLALPTASFTHTTLVCQGSVITFTSTSNPVNGVISGYNWTVNGNAVPGGANMTYVPTGSGNITVALSVTTNNGCVGQVSQTVFVNPRPDAVFTFGNACLPAGALNFTNSTTISDATAMTYEWNFGDGPGVQSTAQNPTYNYAAVGPYNVQLIAQSNAGCRDTANASVNTIFAQPVAAITTSPEVCVSTAHNFSAAGSTAPASTVTGWTWNFGDGTPVVTGTATPTHTYANAGTYTVTLTVSSQVGCNSAPITTQVIVNPLPTANFTISAPNCLNKTITFTDNSTPNAGTLNDWSWNFGDGPGVQSTLPSPTHTYAALGNYNVTLTVKSTKGCVSIAATKPVTISPNPVAKFGLPESCLNDPFSQFTDSSIISDGSMSQFTYEWNFGDGPGVQSTLKDPQHTYTAAGPYSVRLIVHSNVGCTDTLSRPFFVNGAVPVPMFNVQGPTTFCSGGSISLTDNSTVNPGSVVKLEIFWDYTSDPTIKTTDDDPLPGKTYGHTYPEFFTPASRNVTIRYVAYSGQTCLQYVDRVITLYAKPQIQFNAIPGVCQDVPSFSINTSAGVQNGLPGTGVYSGPGVNSTTGVFDPAVAGPGLHTIRYTFTVTGTGCSAYMERVLEVYPKPVANAGPDKFMITGGVVTLTPAVNSGFPVSYSWNPPDYLDNPNSSSPKATPPNDITYTLTVTSDKGCSDSDQVFVKVLQKPLVPNIFSPNGDGIHDTWVVPYLNTYPGCTVDIYNRYGQLVFHSVGYNTPWDGKINGKEAPIGTYYYIIDPKNGRAKMTGYVDIIR